MMTNFDGVAPLLWELVKQPSDGVGECWAPNRGGLKEVQATVRCGLTFLSRLRIFNRVRTGRAGTVDIGFEQSRVLDPLLWKILFFGCNRLSRQGYDTADMHKLPAIRRLSEVD